MFYRKYRPQKFEEISKPNVASEVLMTQISKGKIGHAYLFTGSRGTGKTSTARIFAKAINCEKPTKEGDCCGKCSVCTEIANGSFLDLIEIDAASNRGIDDIRSLRERVVLAPTSAKYKVYIIDEVHMLTNDAFNALLKTLEEPPKHAVFILCTTEFHKVPDTIKSRCQVFKLKRPSIKQIVERLKEICEKEKAEITDDVLEKVARASGGAFRDADTLLQQVIEGNLDINVLGSQNPTEMFTQVTAGLIEGKVQSVLLILDKAVSDGVDVYSFTSEYIRYLRDILFIQSGFEKDFFSVTDEVFSKMEEFGSKLSSAELVFLIERLLLASGDIKGSVIPSLPLEIALVEASEKIKEQEERMNTGYSSPSANRSGMTGQKSGMTSAGLGATDAVIPANAGIQSERTSRTESAVASVDSVLESWGDILREIRPYNHSIEALLRSCKPKSFENGVLTLAVSYAFHKERLETPKNKDILQKVLSNKFGGTVRVNCELTSREGENLTDKNVEAPKDEKVVKDAIDVFDGGVDLNL